MLLLGFRRRAAAGINSELLLIGCSSSAASVGSLFSLLLSAHRGMLRLRCLIKGSLLQHLSSDTPILPSDDGFVTMWDDPGAVDHDNSASRQWVACFGGNRMG